MRIVLGCVAVSLLVWGIPRPASADPVTVRLDRSVSVGASVAISGADVEAENQQSDADVLLTTVTVSSGPNSATGSQSLSSITSTDSRRLSGSGRTRAIAVSPFSGNGTNAGAGGGAIVAWDFRLDQAYLFDFDAVVAPNSDDVSVLLRSSLGAIRGSVFEPVFSHELQGTGDARFVEHGRLEAGLYSFFFQSGAGVFTFEGTKAGIMDLNFHLDLAPAAPVPEPGTMSMLAAGLCAVTAGSLKRRLSA